jgi:hypothetical protein
VAWPPPLDVLSEASNAPWDFMPEVFVEGEPTQREAMIQGLTVLITAAFCLRQSAFISQATSLVKHIQTRTTSKPQQFGDLPSMQGAGDPESNRIFWRLACKIPSRLAP